LSCPADGEKSDEEATNHEKKGMTSLFGTLVEPSEVVTKGSI